MKIYLICTERPAFNPKYIDFILRNSSVPICGITIVRPDARHRKTEVLRHYVRIFGYTGFLLMGIFHGLLLLLNCFKWWGPFSVVRVAKEHNIPYRLVSDVNAQDHVDFLKGLHVDAIIANSDQVFREELLSTARIGVFNRHSALLPSYKGFWPVYWAVVNGEKDIGVTFHKMEKKVDSGDIVLQEKIPIEAGDSLVSLYYKAFKSSASLACQCIQKLSCGELTFSPNGPGTYYLRPGIKERRKFLKRLRIVRPLDFLYFLKNFNL